MNTYVFTDSNGNSIDIQAHTFEEAIFILVEQVDHPADFISI